MARIYSVVTYWGSSAVLEIKKNEMKRRRENVMFHEQHRVSGPEGRGEKKAYWSSR